MNSVIQYLAVGNDTFLLCIEVKINVCAVRVGGSHFKTFYGGKSPNVDGALMTVSN